MTEGARIAEQMRRMMVGCAWHGPSVLEGLDGLSASAAANYPIAGAHSIWELVAHLDATQRIILARLRGDERPLTEADYFPPVADTSSAAWSAILARLKSQEEELMAVAAGLGESRLAESLAGGSSHYENLHGHVQHNAYHAGQIRLLRKLLGA